MFGFEKKYTYAAIAVAVLVVLFFVYYVYSSRPKAFGEDFINGYWIMQVQDDDGNAIDEQVLNISTKKGRARLIYAFDEDEDPVHSYYKVQRHKAHHYRKHDFYLEKTESEDDSPDELLLKLDTISGVLKVLNPNDSDVSYGIFYKDCSL